MGYISLSFRASKMKRIICHGLLVIIFFIYRDLRPEESQRTKPLREIPTSYNYRLVPPRKNLLSLEDRKEVDGFEDFLQNFVDERIGVTIAEADKGIKERKF